MITPADQGANDAADSDADTTTGATTTTTITLGENDPTWDAGLYQLVSLGNLVWNDVNNNGLVDGGENGIDGVVVNLYRDANGNGHDRRRRACRHAGPPTAAGTTCSRTWCQAAIWCSSTRRTLAARRAGGLR